MMKRTYFCACAVFALFCLSSSVTAKGSFLKTLSDAASSAGLINEDTKKLVNAVDTSAAAVASASEAITPEQQYYIGRAVAGTVLKNYKIYNNAQATAYVNKVCNTITQASDKPLLYKGYWVGILDTSEVNAISTPGGHILVTRGLLQCAESEDALAAVIAHEVAHIQLEHAVKAIKSSRATNAILVTADSASSVKGGTDVMGGFGDCVDDIVNQVVTSGYSKNQEYDADKKALSLMNDAGYNPAAMDSMLKLIKKTESSQKAGFCKTHPSADARLNNISSEKKKYNGSYAESSRIARFNKIKGSL